MDDANTGLEAGHELVHHPFRRANRTVINRHLHRKIYTLPQYRTVYFLFLMGGTVLFIGGMLNTTFIYEHGLLATILLTSESDFGREKAEPLTRAINLRILG